MRMYSTESIRTRFPDVRRNEFRTISYQGRTKNGDWKIGVACGKITTLGPVNLTLEELDKDPKFGGRKIWKFKNVHITDIV